MTHRSTLTATLALIALCLVVFWPVLGFELLNWDDRVHLIDNPLFQPPRVENVRHYWSQPYMGLYIPLTYTLWTLLGAVSINPAVFHGANLVLHVACVLIVFVIVRRLIDSTWPAAIGAAIFAVHPLQVETVAWVSGFRDLLGAVLMLASIGLYMKHARGIRAQMSHSERTREESRHPSSFSAPEIPREYARDHNRAIPASPLRLSLELILSTLCFALALLAKPSAVVAPVFILIIGRLLHRPWKPLLIETAPMFALAIACTIWTKLAQPSLYLEPVPWYSRPLVAGDALAFYLFKLVWPVELCFDYGRNPQAIFRGGEVLITWLAPLCLGLVCLLTWRRQRYATACAMLFVAGVLPVLGLVPFDYQDKSTVADRYVYMSMIAVAIVAAVVAKARDSRRFRAVAGFGIVALAVASWLQTWTWRDTRTMAAHGLRINPHSFAALDQLTWLAFDDRNNALAERLARESLVIKPNNQTALINLGRALALQDRHREALGPMRRAVDLRPDDPEAHANLAFALGEMGNLDQAIQHCERALELNPRHGPAKQMLPLLRQAQRQAATQSSE